MTDEANNTFDAKAFLKNLTGLPGVYRMLDEKGTVIYVGKARNLKKRVSSYFNRGNQTAKTQAMVARIRNIEVTITQTENEALILENNLIKTLKPQYNILFRDDKSYPYIYVSTGHPFPQITFHRGVRKKKGRYFGPYPSAGAVRESLNLLQKLFPIRQCEDSYYNNRSRPCLQYQIKRCSGPCVDLINEAEYADDVRHAIMFLEGKNTEVIDELVKKMEAASEKLDFEKAATYRDQIATLRRVQERQYISGEKGDLDVIAAVAKGNHACVQVFFVRKGQGLGNKTFFPRHSENGSVNDVLSAFIAQYYIGKSGARIIPQEIIVNALPEDAEALEEVLAEQTSHKVTITNRCRGERARRLKMAEENATAALTAHLADKANVLSRFEALQDAFNLDDLPQRIECFDISHTMGEATVASCVVFDHNGPMKADYRRYNIEGITGGDDYAAMQQALTRRFRKLVEGEGKRPDILLIDGGKGQLAQAEQVLNELQLDDILLIGVAKGVTRKPGMEMLFLSGQDQPFILPADSAALHLIQHVRDEAHRFAIQGHRARRGKKRGRSPLEEIEGLGPKRRQLLLSQFGGLQGITRAGVEDIAAVKGISKALAEKIYDYFHAE